ncbi:MAG TPA: cytochrome c3 family protein [Candidatus Dormibacteraeota bacterium]|nr:cytochrome c3 family protein [Candidatus Dormibacteraeota bacterium]
MCFDRLLNHTAAVRTENLMTDRNFRLLDGLLSGRSRRLATGVGLVAGVIAMVSCTSVRRSVVNLPMVPGANYVGSKECEQCHEKIYRDFTTTADHARLMTPGPNAFEVGCESCHGPCSLHVQSGAEVKPPYIVTGGRPSPNPRGAAPVLPAGRLKENVCLDCHLDVRGQFNLPSRHPVPEGKMSCMDCHPPHKGSIHLGGGMSLLDANESCFRCHAAQRGPHVFEHEAIREGCSVCHTPHGSVNAKLLTARNANLCLKCHFQRVSGGAILIGGADHSLFLQRLQQGTCWTAGCHEAVHGSRVDSSLRF